MYFATDARSLPSNVMGSARSEPELDDPELLFPILLQGKFKSELAIVVQVGRGDPGAMLVPFIQFETGK